MVMAVLVALVAMGSRAQNDNSTWSGKLSVYGTEITLVFHLWSARRWASR